MSQSHLRVLKEGNAQEEQSGNEVIDPLRYISDPEVCDPKPGSRMVVVVEVMVVRLSGHGKSVRSGALSNEANKLECLIQKFQKGKSPDLNGRAFKRRSRSGYRDDRPGDPVDLVYY